ncbi:uncharacterized protein LOC132883645 [Neoarius graeffei]|uniref:uncharacterized protein LOC132883645 n=1 Tax=Neoarius graeffei TaxID=443677 RepID=UPI00298CAE99|nr:uncharacterized protein LOC132883645 [Neoarius graeffei]
MKETETIALCVLFLFFSSSFIQGENDPILTTSAQNLSSTSSPPQRSSTAKPESLSSPLLLTISSKVDSRAIADLSANSTLSQSSNDTANSTAPGFPIGTAEPPVNTLAPMNSTTVPGNLTDNQEQSNLSAGDNQTSTASNTTLSATTPLPKGEPKTSASAPSTHSQTLSASTKPQITTSPLEITTQSRGKSSTVSTKGTSAPTTKTTTTTTTTTTITTQTTEFNSTPVLAKARVDTLPELNVGDDTDYSGTSVDPLLAGLVSVFIVTAAIVSLLIFMKFRHRNERPEFRRLQDLPMDDMMEDTPLSMYSY